ncbi:hypothetical protein [Tabrizicola sp.]|uniref:hypothetical protein n=1 Tax=Tabrizicola sp. TaxID=2005166 RepID=UPI003454EF59
MGQVCAARRKPTSRCPKNSACPRQGVCPPGLMLPCLLPAAFDEGRFSARLARKIAAFAGKRSQARDDSDCSTA